MNLIGNLVSTIYEVESEANRRIIGPGAIIWGGPSKKVMG